MRILGLVVALALMNTCSSASATGGTVDFRLAGSGAYANETERKAIAALDDESYTKTWGAMIDPNGEMAPIDFSSESAVFLFGGQRNSGGYVVDVRGVTLEGDTLVIDAVVQGPPPGSMTTQALTQPWTVIAVKSRKVKNVRWQP